MFSHSSVLVTSLRQGSVTHQLQASQLSMTGKWRGICQIAPIIRFWGCNSFLKMEEANIMCPDKAKELGAQVFCFLSSDTKKRSMPGSAESVPTEQCQAHANLEVCQSRATSVNSYCEAEGTHTQRPDLGYHSLPREGQSNHLSLLCSFSILVSVLLRK